MTRESDKRRKMERKRMRREVFGLELEEGMSLLRKNRGFCSSSRASCGVRALELNWGMNGDFDFPLSNK